MPHHSPKNVNAKARDLLRCCSYAPVAALLRMNQLSAASQVQAAAPIQGRSRLPMTGKPKSLARSFVLDCVPPSQAAVQSTAVSLQVVGQLEREAVAGERIQLYFVLIEKELIPRL